MEDNTQDVLKAMDSSPVEEQPQDVEIQEPIQPEQPVEQDTSTPPVPETGETIQSEVDELGVPYKNRYMESQRKLDKVTEKLTSFEEKIDTLGQGQQEKEYSIGELQAFAQSTDDPNHAQWAWNQVHELEKKESVELIRQEIGKLQEVNQVAKLKEDTFRAVTSRNPELIINDNAGNFVGWNQKSPLFQRMNFYMQNPRVSNNPDALDIAEALAMRDLTRSQTPQVVNKLAQQKNQISSLQKKTLVEGQGSQVQGTTSPRQAAIEQAKSGTMKDAQTAMDAILRATGQIND